MFGTTSDKSSLVARYFISDWRLVRNTNNLQIIDTFVEPTTTKIDGEDFTGFLMNINIKVI